MHIHFIEYKCFHKYQIFFIQCKYILLNINFIFAKFQQPYTCAYLKKQKVFNVILQICKSALVYL